MGKLVRDRVPELFDGHSRPLDEVEYRAALRGKLQEEVSEYLESGEVHELADVLEVMQALAGLDGVSAAGLEDMRKKKAAERGAFDARLWWTAT
ncbi:nucleoside triphosphate pyrophosphohydrolase [Deinococcus koreensis]|uniref:Phosphoribosyl-ATP pyrophosphohydrolase n=1 Tax=Deinococcus koreensis TaxID=2054903 RepID=A0A2K3UU88_9DEIO|nr:nucleoside triphosphate pyrophosphohydrolase [Deinococcus koreensis]PNY80088.1 hypothetical protein CVO96_00830 [Deinococcus koreensis]